MLQIDLEDVVHLGVLCRVYAEVQNVRASRSHLQAQEQRNYRNLLGEDDLSIDVTLDVIFGTWQGTQGTVTGRIKICIGPSGVVGVTPTTETFFFRAGDAAVW